MKKLITLLSGALFAGAVHAQIPAALQTKFHDTLVAMQSKYQFKGLSAAVSFKSLGIWKDAAGISTASTPLSTDMLIGIGSNTKTFVSAMMLKLKEAGKVNLNDTIGKWVSGYPNIKGSITVRQILNHTSGINSYTNNLSTWDSINKDLSRIWTKDEILRKFVQAPSFAPGTSWEYCNTNFIIAALIEEQICGKPIEQVLRDSILTPQGLKHTFFPPYEIATDPYAHLWSDFNGDDILDDVGEYATSTMLPKEINSIADGAGALVSTAEDNVKFWSALMGGSIIGKSTIVNDLLSWSGFGTSTSEYGLGIFKARYLGNIVFSHGGTWIGQINENLADTGNRIFITVLSNQDSLQNDMVLKVVLALYKVALDYSKLSIDDKLITSTASFTLYPNPAKNEVHIYTESNEAKTIRMYDVTGRMVQSVNVPATEHQVQMALNDFVPGTYIVELVTETTNSRERLNVVH